MSGPLTKKLIHQITTPVTAEMKKEILKGCELITMQDGGVKCTQERFVVNAIKLYIDHLHQNHNGKNSARKAAKEKPPAYYS